MPQILEMTVIFFSSSKTMIQSTRLKKTIKWFNDNGISVLEWPCQSRDLNPIENLWKTLKLRVHARDSKDIKELMKVCEEEWLKLPANACKKLLDIYGKRLEAMRWNRG